MVERLRPVISSTAGRRPFSTASRRGKTSKNQPRGWVAEPGWADWDLSEQAYASAVREYSHRLADGR